MLYTAYSMLPPGSAQQASWRPRRPLDGAPFFHCNTPWDILAMDIVLYPRTPHSPRGTLGRTGLKDKGCGAPSHRDKRLGPRENVGNVGCVRAADPYPDPASDPKREDCADGSSSIKASSALYVIRRDSPIFEKSRAQRSMCLSASRISLCFPEAQCWEARKVGPRATFS